MLVFIEVFMSVLLLIGIISPKTAWKVSEGWKFKNAEPSAFYLIFSRITSLIILIIIWFVIPS